MSDRDELRREFVNETGWADIPDRLAEHYKNNEKTGEYFRVLKVHEYITKILLAVDPDLVPLQRWKNCRSMGQDCLNYISNLQQLNSMADEILESIAPFVSNSKDAAIAAGHAFSRYKSEVEKELNRLGALVKEALDELNPRIEDATKNLQKLEELKSEIEKFRTELFKGSEEEESIESKIRQTGDNIEKMHNRAKRYLEKLLGREKEDEKNDRFD